MTYNNLISNNILILYYLTKNNLVDMLRFKYNYNFNGRQYFIRIRSLIVIKCPDHHTNIRDETRDTTEKM